MKTRVFALFASLYLAAALLIGSPVLGKGLQGMQVITIEGRFLDWEGNAIEEYDYLEPDHRYRLLPEARVEISTIDGSKSYSADGPGVFFFDSSGKVFLNGKSLQAKIERPLLENTVLHETSQTAIAGIPLRGDRISVRTQQGKKIALYDNSYALVVGNGDYINGWDPLPGAIGDVAEIATALEENGFTVVLKTNITREDFSKAFWKFCYENGKSEENRLLFYYAGHGYTQEMKTGEDLGYLVMVDAPLPEKDPMGFDLASVDMQAIVTQAKMIKAKHALFMFDSCFSGSVLNFRGKVVPENISESVSLPVRQFITAGRANEPVPDRSIFKQAFLDILEGRDKEPIPDGYLTGEELGLYLKNKVPEYNARQHPQYGRIKDIELDKGDFVFVLKGHNRVLQSQQDAPEGHRPEQEMAKMKREKPRVLENPPSVRKTTPDAHIPPQEPESAVSTASKTQTVSSPGRFTGYSNGAVLDQKTQLMWASTAVDAGQYFSDAVAYCEDYRGGGYTDWRLPTVEELETLYDEKITNRYGYHTTELIQVSGQYVFAFSTRWGGQAAFDFKNGIPAVDGITVHKNPAPFRHIDVRTLPVRSVH